MKRGSYSDDRAQPDIGDPVDPASRERVVGAVAGDLHRVDAEGRAQIVAKTEIDGRKADRAAAPVAFHDAPVDLPISAELHRRLARLSRPAAPPGVGRGNGRR